MPNSMPLVASAVFTVALLGWACHAGAASFDCKKAGSQIEHLICKDPDLSSFDSQLQAAYLGALDRSNHPAQVKEKQQAWLKQRDACADTKCLSAVYTRQIKLLSSLSDEPPVCSGGTTPEVNACGREYSHRADRELDRYVAATRARLIDDTKDDPSSEEAKAALAGFNASHIAWAAYRKAECTAVYNGTGGTISGLVYEQCYLTVTKSRTRDVWSIWLQYGDSTPPILPEPTAK